ncbi:Uncharacterised protein [Klebsiella quasivariicola]|nr:Uncharacterised protein [Klebsiella quasivariicola]
MPRQAIVTRFHGDLIGAEVSARGERRALPGFKIEAVLPGDTVKLRPHRPRFIKHCQLDAELFEPFFAATDALENQPARRAAADGFNLGGDVRQHAALGRNGKLVDNPVHRIQHPAQVLHVVSDRVNADHRVPRAKRKPFIDLRSNTLHIITGVVRLQAAAEGSRQTDGGIGFFDHRHFFAAVDQIGVGADLGHCRHHF